MRHHQEGHGWSSNIMALCVNDQNKAFLLYCSCGKCHEMHFSTGDFRCSLSVKKQRPKEPSWIFKAKSRLLQGFDCQHNYMPLFCYDKCSRHLIYTADQYTFRLHCSEIITLLISAQVFIPDVKYKLVSTRL